MQQTLMLRDMQKEELPRERLERYGPSSLSLAELLAIIIRCGTRDENVLDLSRRIVSGFGLDALKDMTPAEICMIKGIKKAKASQIIAVFEIARRLSQEREPYTLRFRNSGDVTAYLAPKMKGLKKEHLIGLYLDSKNRLLKEETISVGTLDSSLSHPREIFRSAVREPCASIILVHNHPSGDPQPSPDDINVTKKLIQASDIMGIELLDHIIIGSEKHVSLKEDRFI